MRKKEVNSLPFSIQFQPNALYNEICWTLIFDQTILHYNLYPILRIFLIFVCIYLSIEGQGPQKDLYYFVYNTQFFFLDRLPDFHFLVFYNNCYLKKIENMLILIQNNKNFSIFHLFINERVTLSTFVVFFYIIWIIFFTVFD